MAVGVGQQPDASFHPRRSSRQALVFPEIAAQRFRDVTNIGESRRRSNERPGGDGGVSRLGKDSVSFRIVDRSRPIRRASGAKRAQQAIDIAEDRWRKRRRPHFVPFQNLKRLCVL
jgi:hypothetical protein